MLNDVWGVELWGSTIAKVWGGIKDRSGRTVKSYDFDKLPDALPTKTPCALSYIIGKPPSIDYSQGGPCNVVWNGATEFHLTDNLDRSALSNIWQFYRLITTAAAKSLTLNGLVDTFVLKSSGSIDLVTLQYGSEVEHYGLVVYWEVYETITGKLIVGV